MYCSVRFGYAQVVVFHTVDRAMQHVPDFTRSLNMAELNPPITFGFRVREQLSYGDFALIMPTDKDPHGKADECRGIEMADRRIDHSVC